ncbi:hypothetical protein [Dactylosporangium sp. NPDC048998]|uniref:hypothetical protein n=1 Tax=Dactylosporangium sp. NPDC048998 TaxID=3363976 RepID=UPI00371693FB
MTRPMARLATLLLALAAGALGAAAPAGAALPDRFAFVLWNGSATVATGTVPAATTVVIGAPGRYRITFPGSAAARGVVHVTAINDSPHWCQANTWGPSGADELVYVDCYKAGGTPDYTAFTAIFESSSPPTPAINGRFGYVDALPTGALVSQFNSAGAVNSVSPLATGQWAVKMPNLSTPGPVDGSLQATAVSSTPARCKVAKWSSAPSGQLVYVFCFDALGSPVDTRFTLTYQYQQSLYGAGWPPKYFGYLWNAPPLGPPSTNFNSQLGSGVNTLASAGVGLYLVTFPKLGVTPDTIQVTATGTGSEFCSLLTFWTHPAPDTVVRDVSCSDNSGNRVDTGFLISDNSAF